MHDLITNPPRFLFFTGKGGVGKTSMSSAVSVALAKSGKKVLLISTDPASNLDEVLGTPLSSKPCEVNGLKNLYAMNIDPIEAAQIYRESVVAPYRGVLPDEAVDSIEEQLSGACTVELASFNEFAQYIGNEKMTELYDHIVLDTAPTGHTLRLLNLPSAWNEFIVENKTGNSCLGPLSGLNNQRSNYENTVNALKDKNRTLLVLVSRPEPLSLSEAERASVELYDQGMCHQLLILNGLFRALSPDLVAKSFEEKSNHAVENLPKHLSTLPRVESRFRAGGFVGLESLATAFTETPKKDERPIKVDQIQKDQSLSGTEKWSELITGLESDKNGVIMLMGKGGVGKTSMASAIALELARRGHSVQLTTTDPAAHITDMISEGDGNLKISRIDPKKVTKEHVANMIAKNEGKLSDSEMELLKEEMKSPCIEEMAVFLSFASTVSLGENQFVVLDTAPTGHTLLLLDATESYHRQIAGGKGELSSDVVNLLPRLRDPKFTKVLITTLAEATPMHEAERLQVDLERAGISPFGWIINQSFALTKTEDPTLIQKGQNELEFIREISTKLSKNTVISPWRHFNLVGKENLLSLIDHF
jgi:arsenite/tail-anchored protein-transporting ATPase